MLKKICGVLGASLILGLASCSEDNPWMGDNGKGAIKLNLSADGSFKDELPQTRADGSEYFDLPDVEDFYIHLYKEGQLHSSYTHSEFMGQDNQFETGKYTLKAFSGSLEKEGFDVQPYFEGTTDVTVYEGKESVASVEATLGHALVTVTYTDAFKSYMRDYSSQLKSEGPDFIEVKEENIGQNAFVVPGEISVKLDFTDPQGRQLSLMPSFVTKPATRYQVEFNVNDGNVGFPALDISFIAGLDRETVTIDLTDDLFTAQPPVVEAENFEDGESLDFLSGASQDESYRFNVLSYGGLGSVKLTLSRIEGAEQPMPFSGEIDLIKATEAEQQQLANAGFVCRGLFRNPDKMAYIDFSNVPSKLPAGQYRLTVVATDMLTRVSEPVNVTLNVKDARVIAEPVKANPVTHEGTVIITYNGGNTDAISFKALNARGMMENAPVKSIANYTRAFEDRDYLFTITLPEFGERTEEEVEVYLNNQWVSRIKLPVSTSFEADAFATKALIKVVAVKNKIGGVMANAKISVFKEGQPVEVAVASKDESTGIFTLTGLEPNTHYTFTVTGYENGESFEGEFTTEAIQALENGDFSSMQQTINIERIYAGGIYTYYAVFVTGTYLNKSSIVVDTPTAWGNINDITCDYAGSQNKNTWYVVPSTIGDTNNNTVKVRTVGYNHNGPELASWSSTINNFYSQVSPDRSELDVAAGQLFYGNNSATGVNFTSRPSSVSFEYSYAPVNGESAKVVVKVLSDGEVIGSGQSTFGDGTTGTVAIAYDNAFGKKATNLSLVFYSSSATSPEIVIPTGTDLKDNDKRTSPDVGTGGLNNTETNGSILSANSYKSLAVGSVLTLSNVKLNY